MNTVDALKKLYKTMAGKNWPYGPNVTDAEVIAKIADDTPEGGGSSGVKEKEVVLRDYDGTIIASYSPSEFLALSKMPAAPSHEGLVAQGWNCSLEKAKEYVSKYGRLNVGQMYTTDDGTTRIYINVENTRLSPVLTLGVNGTVDIDWGDGTEHETLAGSSLEASVTTQAHTYAQTGDYVIKLSVEGNAKLCRTSGVCFFSNAPTNWVKKIEIGDSVTSIGNSAFASCYALSNITIPDSVTSIGDYMFNSCYALLNITIPDSVTSISNSAFATCASLSNITIPDSVTSIDSGAFSNCYGLSNITIPDSVTSIGNTAFASCYALSNITIPDSVTSIGSGAFTSCRNMADYHLKPTTPPSLAQGALTVTSQTIIYVPYSEDHSILNAYKSATNWSSFASNMQEEPAA